MGVILFRDPLIVTIVRLHVVTVFFLDKLSFYTEILHKLLVGRIKNIIIDFVHPNIALLYLFFCHDAISTCCISTRIRF